MESIIRNVGKWGNSAGVLLPKEWAGNQVNIILIERTEEIKKEVFDILADKLEEIMGIYLVGSYARAEMREDSDIDIVAISSNLREEIVSGKYHISVIPIDIARRNIKKNPLMLLPRLIEAKVLLNRHLLSELKKIKFEKGFIKRYIDETKDIMKINSGLLELNKIEKYTDNEILYSLVLRIRGIFILNCLLNKKSYSNKLFFKNLEKGVGKNESKEIYRIYKSYRADKKIDRKIKLETGRKLLEILRKDIKDARWQSE